MMKEKSRKKKITEKEFQMKLKIPESVKILDEKVRKEVLEAVEKKMRPNMEKEFHVTVKEIIAKKLDILETPKEGQKELKSSLLKEQKVPVKKTKHCPECGKELDADMKFCTFCGATLKQKPPPPEEKKVPVKKTKHCPECGKELDADMKFCRFCGSKLE